MTKQFSGLFFNALAAFALSATLFTPAQAGSACSGNGMVLLTVTGDMKNPNRGAYDNKTDKIFGFNEIGFAAGAQFDFQCLEKLGMIAVTADFPKGGDIHVFEGPRLQDVLDAAGVEGEMLTIRALDGYTVRAPRYELIAKGAIVALKRDGKYFGIGGFGPTQIVFPRSERADLADMNDDNWVWSIYHISVE